MISKTAVSSRVLALIALIALALAAAPAPLLAAPAKPAAGTEAKPAPEPPKPPAPPDDTNDDDADDDGDRPGHRHWETGNDGVNIFDELTIPAGQTHDGNIDCIRCHLTIDGHVNGDVVVVAGKLDLNGSVDGDVVTVVSQTKMAPGVRIEGQLTNVGGRLDRNGASVAGEVFNLPLGLTFPMGAGLWGAGWGLFSSAFFWWKMFAVFLFFVCALLLSALVPDRIRLISEETPVRLFSAFLIGLVGYMVLAMVQMFLFVTIIGIPLVFLVYLVFVVLKWLAMCGVFHQIGTRVGRAFGREMSLLGGILLGLLPFALLRFVPFCIGWSIWFLVEILAFGCLILTRVGTRRSATFVAPQPPPPPPPPPPVTVVDPGPAPTV
jgi:hypothetical protein